MCIVCVCVFVSVHVCECVGRLFTMSSQERLSMGSNTKGEH